MKIRIEKIEVDFKWWKLFLLVLVIVIVIMLFIWMMIDVDFLDFIKLLRS